MFIYFIVAPLISDTSGLTEILLGRPAALACLATGFPLPSLLWSKIGEEMNSFNDSKLDSRLKIIEVTAESLAINSSNGSDFQGSIADLLKKHTDITTHQVLQLGELGIVGLLFFEETTREDTANYTCTAKISSPKTNTLIAVSDNISLVILGECIVIDIKLNTCTSVLHRTS